MYLWILKVLTSNCKNQNSNVQSNFQMFVTAVFIIHDYFVWHIENCWLSFVEIFDSCISYRFIIYTWLVVTCVHGDTVNSTHYIHDWKESSLTLGSLKCQERNYLPSQNHNWTPGEGASNNTLKKVKVSFFKFAAAFFLFSVFFFPIVKLWHLSETDDLSNCCVYVL